MKTWEKGCRSSYGSSYNFTGVPFLGGSFNQYAALANAKPNIDRVVKEIKKDLTKEYILVGHSSGGHIPAAVARLLPKGAKVKIVNLDGPKVGADLQDQIPTACLSNYNSVSTCRNLTAFKPVGCKRGARMCQHFRMVNKNAPYDLTGTDRGYENFSCNLDWLKRLPGGVPGGLINASGTEK